MEKKVERAHTDFLRQITGNQARRIVDGTWKTPEAGVVQEAAGKNSAMAYIGRRQATTEKWVVLQPIFEFCKGEKGYTRGGRRREAWWRQEATYK